MSAIRIESAEKPFDSAELARRAAGVITAAEAMGLLEGVEVKRLDLATFRRVTRRIAAAGIGRDLQAAFLSGAMPKGAMRSALVQVERALEESPSPEHEWRAMEELLGSDRLAALLGLSAASIRRYRSGARPTPDKVADRLHLLARVVGDLAGAYNDVGIRRWFERPRTLLGGKAPQDLLRGDWDVSDADVRRVRELARSLSASAAT